MCKNFLFNKTLLIVERKTSFLRTISAEKICFLQTKRASFYPPFYNMCEQNQYKLLRISSEILYSGA